MRLVEMLEGLSYHFVGEKKDPELTGLVYDSRKIVPGCVFVCISGAVKDGHEFAAMAVENGAAAVVSERELELPKQVTQVVTEDTRKALAYMSAAWFSHPADKLITIGITGTKGKTTTAYMVQQMLTAAGMKTGLIGTVEIQNGKETIPASKTTPESY